MLDRGCQRVSLSFALAALCVLLSAALPAAEYFVSPTGTDAGMDGATGDRPWSLAQANRKAAPGPGRNEL